MIDFPLLVGAPFRPVEVPRLRVTSAPAVEPLSVADAKSHIEVYDTGKDSLIGSLITAARVYCEQIQNRAYITQTLELTLDDWPSNSGPIVLPMPRLQSVTSVKYTPDGGAETTLSPSLYIVDTKSEPGRIVLKTDEEWPSDDLQPVNGITIVYKAGYGDAAANVPATVIHAIKFLVGAWFEQRAALADQSSGNVMEVPMAFWSLIAIDRVVRFA